MKCGNKNCGYRSGDLCQECNNTSFLPTYFGGMGVPESCLNYIPANTTNNTNNTNNINTAILNTAILMKQIDPNTAIPNTPVIHVIQKKNEEICNKEVKIKLLQNELNTQKLEIATLHENNENLKQQSERATTIIKTKEQEITDLKLEILTLQNKPINSHDNLEV